MIDEADDLYKQLAAKDAEIAELKAALSIAREALDKVLQLANIYTTKEVSICGEALFKIQQALEKSQ